MHQISIYHDYIAAVFEGQGSVGEFFGSLFGSKANMVPAALYTYARLYNAVSPYYIKYDDLK
jgi:hypothetical protein